MNDIINIVSNIEDNNVVKIYFCKKIDKNHGTLNIDDTIFKNIKKKLNNIADKKSVEETKVYTFLDKKLIVCNDIKKYERERIISSNIIGNFIINEIEYLDMDEHEFPMINNYHNYEELKTEKYSVDNYIAHCIKNKNINYLVLEGGNNIKGLKKILIGIK